MTDASQNIEDFTKEYLRRIDQRLETVLANLSNLTDTTGRIDIRLKVVEAHMTGFMSSAKHLETEIDTLRGRIEALEERVFHNNPP